MSELNDRKFIGTLILLMGAFNGAREAFRGTYDALGLTLAVVLGVIGTFMLMTTGSHGGHDDDFRQGNP